MYVTVQTTIYFADTLRPRLLIYRRLYEIAPNNDNYRYHVYCGDPDECRANTGYQRESSPPSYSGTLYGVIESIEMTPGESGEIAGSGIGAGTVIGGVVGGVLGHQVGGGTGKDIATVAGVVGGAVVGHET